MKEKNTKKTNSNKKSELNKKNLIIIGAVGLALVVLIIILVLPKQKQETSSKEEGPKKGYILSEKTRFDEFCKEVPCEQTLGKVDLKGDDITLKVNITGTDKEMNGSVLVNDKQINLTELKSLEEEPIYIEGFEKYDKYLLIYSRGDTQTEGYHSNRLTLVDKNGDVVVYLDGTSCSNFENDYDIEDGNLTYISMDEKAIKDKLYKEDKNTNNYNILATKKTIKISDLLHLEMDKTSKIKEIYYNCGYFIGTN